MSNIGITHLPALRVVNYIDGVEIELELINASASFLYIATDDKEQRIAISDDALDGLVAAIEVFKAKRKYYRF